MNVLPALAPAVTTPAVSTVASAVVLDQVTLGAGLRISESLASNTESIIRIVLSCSTRDVSTVVGCSFTRAPNWWTVTELGAKKLWKYVALMVALPFRCAVIVVAGALSGLNVTTVSGTAVHAHG